MNKSKFIFTKVAALILSVVLIGMMSGCEQAPPTPVDKLAQKAAAAAQEAAALTVEPQEINMILWRRELMGKPGLQLYIVFINDMGQPIDYFTSGKCTSSNKRLTDGTALVLGDKGSYNGYFDVPAASEDGTYGESDEYIYCKTIDGKYKQWNGDYYLSDRPIELTIKPLVVKIGTKTQQQQ